MEWGGGCWLMPFLSLLWYNFKQIYTEVGNIVRRTFVYSSSRFSISNVLSRLVHGVSEPKSEPSGSEWNSRSSRPLTP